MKVYVINIPSDVERLEGFNTAYPKGLPTPIIYPAKTGSEVDVPEWWMGTANAWALTQNIKDILSLEHTEPIMICEDDCAFSTDFTSVLQTLMENVPADWDILYPGGRHRDLLYAYPIKVNDYVLKCRFTIGTYCWIINPESCQKIVDLFNTERWECYHTCDNMLASSLWSNRLTAYAPLKSIAGQRGGVPSTMANWAFPRTTFFNEFRYYDKENQVFMPSGALYDAEAEEEDDE